MELKDIKGIGEKRIQILKNKGINSGEDLAMYFPKTYYDLNSKETFKEDGKYKLINCEVTGDVKLVRIKKTFNYSYAECTDIENNSFKAVWYNQPYIKNAIKTGDKLYLYGKNSNTKHNYFVVSSFRNHNKIQEGTNLLPVYRTFGGLGQTTLSSIINDAVQEIETPTYLPEFFEEKQFTLSLKKAIKTIHSPNSLEELHSAKERLDIENILPYIKISEDLKNNKNLKKQQKYVNFDDIYNKFCDFLPYKLTDSQLEVLSDIKKDFYSSSPMNRLVQGDVGTGKTIVALITCAVCVKSGYNAVLIAPTEILAKQHYQEATNYFNQLGLNVLFLSSSTKAKERKEIVSIFNSLEPTLLIGTHSCLSDDLDMSRTGLLIIDEQHRFGVKQRSAILDKNSTIDFLMLSATPIPRSMSIVYYGGLDVSLLNNPPKEKQIQTNIVSPQKENDMWNFIENKIQDGSKVYVVCANIDDNDDDFYQGLSVKSMYDKLCKRFSKDIVLMAHGKQDGETENKTLSLFRNSDYKILVSTTIIEVGVDVKNADIMVIVSPEKFGLATMHQLRGRVGRAGQQAYCFCLSQNISEKSADRILFFKENLNGFDIAEFDYKSRGSGNLLGTTQHGKTEDIFELISLNTFNKAKDIYEKLKEEYNTDEVFEKSLLFNKLSYFF